MSKKIVSEAEVKKALAINNFREVSKEKLVDFISLIPNMDKDVAVSVINQFPTYADYAKNMVSTLKDMCDGILAENNSSQMEVISAYRKILDELSELLKKDDLSPEERTDITEKMILVADKISEEDTKNKEWLAGVLKCGVSVLGLTLIVGATILGVNIKGKNIPSIKK